ncbi:MAG: SPFH domain-containing protein [Candidatus Eisenbacteria bacterium]|nr:SPFH domain-containing protein [Candidatus Eisenbacteria bacterium]
MDMQTGVMIGFAAWFLVRFVLPGFYTVGPNQRAVKTVFGRAQRLRGLTTLDDPIAELLRETEKERYSYPQVRVIMPGGPYFKWPWEKVYKVSVATETANMAWDPETPEANRHGTVLEAVTKDQLNTGLTGQIRFQVSERNLYAYVFGVTNPIAHVMGYFVSVLRERIATFEAPGKAEAESTPGAISVEGISINDLRKNLRDLNEHMDKECQCSQARYGIRLDASLITGIDPPPEVESALAAINTAHNQVSSDISLATAAADQRIVESKRAVEIETLKAEADVEPLRRLAAQLTVLKQNGTAAMDAYVRTVKLALFAHADRVITEVKP